ncbi:hypothetical protein GUJ93_ZPchr0010g10844 [Zizania palustris]|uniref:Inositol-tetrakisphosphate 1-kinase N-terminal domain-containing protein n=1 Tax=Zizania palustris TaxID=103762 RepID=A0A8J5WCZ2_ZIZPA|nr:hypothetical protein GUJ93_ZPchr0010g10844 [Zizania palustris]
MRVQEEVSDEKEDKEEEEAEAPDLVTLSTPPTAAASGGLRAKKKVKSFLLPNLLALARKKGIHFISIDETRPLPEQGPFDIILHKLTNKE